MEDIATSPLLLSREETKTTDWTHLLEIKVKGVSWLSWGKRLLPTLGTRVQSLSPR